MRCENEKLKYVEPHKYSMGNLTLFMPDELLKKMKEMREIRWSEIARQAIERRVNELRIEENILKRSKITTKDIVEISSRIKKEVAEEFDKM